MVKLTRMVKTSGCAAKLAAKDLQEVLSSLPKKADEKLLVGFEGSDDALVYDLGNGEVMISTVDFFPPVADDPYTFGQIAAANALSDVYAMGGNPKVCMNLVCFPSCQDLDILKQILTGGCDKVHEAGAVVAGGHTIADSVIKYGLSVTGFGKKNSFWTNAGAKEGDVIVLTKKIGVGIINTAAKADEVPDALLNEAIYSMKTLNKRAKEAAEGLDVHAATDITGFSLIGHLYEMASSSRVSITIDHGSVPLFDDVVDLARFGFLSEGVYNNREFIGESVHFDPSLKREICDVLFDPQTSGGLALAMGEPDAAEYLKRMSDTPAAMIARVGKKGYYPVYVV